MTYDSAIVIIVYSFFDSLIPTTLTGRYQKEVLNYQFSIPKCINRS